MEQKFYEYERSFDAIIETLTKKNYPEWRGFITMNGPLVERPDILFIEVNPGQNLYRQHNNKPSFRVSKMYSENFKYDRKQYPENNLKYRKDGTVELEYFCIDNYKKGSGEWYNCKLRKESAYMSNFINIISNTAKVTTGEKFVVGKQPEWYDTFGKKIMMMNINPIATDNKNELDKLMNRLKLDTWKDIVRPLRALVKSTIKPKVIVFMGKAVCESFVTKADLKVNPLNTILGIPYITVYRKPGWDSDRNLGCIADQIAKQL